MLIWKEIKDYDYSFAVAVGHGKDQSPYCLFYCPNDKHCLYHVGLWDKYHAEFESLDSPDTIRPTHFALLTVPNGAQKPQRGWGGLELSLRSSVHGRKNDLHITSYNTKMV